MVHFGRCFSHHIHIYIRNIVIQMEAYFIIHALLTIERGIKDY